MPISRKEALRVGALSGATALLAGCKQITDITHPGLPISVELPSGPVDPTLRLVNRVSFGPAPGELAKVAKMGASAYLDEQLEANQADPTFLKMRLRQIPAYNNGLLVEANPVDLAGTFGWNQIAAQLQQAAILRAVYSPNQLFERMVELWSDHFNIYALKGHLMYFKAVDEMKVIRQHALGKFPDMVRASAKSPAMLAYLDNQVNMKRDPKTGSGANENYARELLELHTLGVHGGYTQKDVMEVARCLTGWTIEDRFMRPRGRFRYNEGMHDNGEKIVLGTKIPAGGGISDGEKVLDIVTMHPSTAKFISGKICRYFLGSEESGWVDRLSGIYLKTGGDIKEMLKPLLLSDDLLQSPPILKRPFDFMASSLRVTGADTNAGADNKNDRGLQKHLENMGQPLFQWPMPDGYPTRPSAWMGSLLGRWNYALSLTMGKIPNTTTRVPELVKRVGAESDQECVDALIQLVLSQPAGAPVVQPLRQKLAAHFSNVPRHNDKNNDVMAGATALLLSSPEFQWR